MFPLRCRLCRRFYEVIDEQRKLIEMYVERLASAIPLHDPAWRIRRLPVVVLIDHSFGLYLPNIRREAENSVNLPPPFVASRPSCCSWPHRTGECACRAFLFPSI